MLQLKGYVVQQPSFDPESGAIIGRRTLDWFPQACFHPIAFGGLLVGWFVGLLSRSWLVFWVCWFIGFFTDGVSDFFEQIHLYTCATISPLAPADQKKWFVGFGGLVWWLVWWLVYWFIGLLVCRFVGWFVGLLVCWFVGSLVCWFVGLLVCLFVCFFVCLFVCLLVCDGCYKFCFWIMGLFSLILFPCSNWSGMYMMSYLTTWCCFVIFCHLSSVASVPALTSADIAAIRTSRKKCFRVETWSDKSFSLFLLRFFILSDFFKNFQNFVPVTSYHSKMIAFASFMHCWRLSGAIFFNDRLNCQQKKWHGGFEESRARFGIALGERRSVKKITPRCSGLRWDRSQMANTWVRAALLRNITFTEMCWCSWTIVAEQLQTVGTCWNYLLWTNQRRVDPVVVLCDTRLLGLLLLSDQTTFAIRKYFPKTRRWSPCLQMPIAFSEFAIHIFFACQIQFKFKFVIYIS